MRLVILQTRACAVRGSPEAGNSTAAPVNESSGYPEGEGKIEQTEAEQKSLEHRVEFATVELNLTEEYKAQLLSPPLSAATRLHNALVEGYRNATETLLGIVLFFAEYC